VDKEIMQEVFALVEVVFLRRSKEFTVFLGTSEII
jgi:hypothetical protein